MKKFCISIALLSCAIPQSCKKEENTANTQTNTYLTSAKTFFIANVQTAAPVIKAGNPQNRRTQAAKNILWDRAYTVQLPLGKAVVVPVHYLQPLFLQANIGGNNRYSLDNLAKLLLYSDNENTWHAELVTNLPDTVFLKRRKPAPFSGITLVEDWWGNPLKKLMFASNGTFKKYNPAPSSPAAENIIIESCYSIEGYNYSVDDPSNGVYWSESLGCSDTYIDGGGGDGSYGGLDGTGGSGSGGAGGAGGTNAGLAITGGPAPITDFADYMKCFTNNPASARYKLTVCVAEPVPGTRETWAMTIHDTYPITIGHSFLIFTETDGLTTTTRNVGFYPTGPVSPWSTSSQGQLNDNSSRAYTISATYSVTNTQFFNIMGYVMHGNDPGFNFDFNSNNCTTFVINAFQAGGIMLPSTIGSWLNGSGNDPGDLGEDLRTRTDLQGNPMISTSPSAHPNVGACN